jgi:hypothetical protein
MKAIAILGCAMAFACAVPSVRADTQEIFVYSGICDASAAVALGKDHFVVADDERNVLLIYKRGQSVAVGQTDLTKFLETKSDKESDIEGAAAIGNKIFWITSHGANKNGEVQKRRQKLFATAIVDAAVPTVRETGKPYGGLMEVLATDPRFAKYKLAAAAGKPPKEEGALNIEGLAATQDGKLLIGFRNPLPGKKALVVPLENPDEVVMLGATAKLGDPIEIDKLDGRGIRSLERVGTSYLIVAGPIDAESGFDLYRWTGNARDDPAKLEHVKLTGLNPEALFAIPGTDAVQILSDDGTVDVGGGTKCKDAPTSAQSFRSITVKP